MSLKALIVQTHLYTPLVISGPHIRAQIFRSRREAKVKAKLKTIGFSRKQDHLGREFWVHTTGHGITAMIVDVKHGRLGIGSMDGILDSVLPSLKTRFLSWFKKGR